MILLTALVVLVLLLALVGLVGYFAELLHADLIAQAPTDAAPAPAPPARVQACARDYCMVPGCPHQWEISIAGWRTCRGHDRRTPYDQNLTPESVIDAARRITREEAA